MEIYIDSSQMPYNYEMCLNEKCPKAETCLRQIATRSVPEYIPFWKIVSPTYLAKQEGDCPYYRASTKVRFAKGCLQLLEGLPHKQMREVIAKLISSFSERTYYRIRNGERLLSPAEQGRVMNILKRCGVSMPQVFDAYVEGYDW